MRGHGGWDQGRNWRWWQVVQRLDVFWRWNQYDFLTECLVECEKGLFKKKLPELTHRVVFWFVYISSMNTFISLVKVAQSCLTLCDPMDYIDHGILQARILAWIAVPFSRGSSQPRDRTQVSRIAGGFFTDWATRHAREYWSG